MIININKKYNNIYKNVSLLFKNTELTVNSYHKYFKNTKNQKLKKIYYSKVKKFLKIYNKQTVNHFLKIFDFKYSSTKFIHKKNDLYSILKYKVTKLINNFNFLKNKNIIYNNFYNINKYNIFLFRESLKYYININKNIYIKNLFFKNLHIYTGFDNILIKFKSLFKSNKKTFENMYIKLFEYNKNFLDINKKYCMSSKYIKNFVIDKFQQWNLFYKKIERKFTWYELKSYSNFLKKFYYYITIPIYDLSVKFQFISNILFDIFKYLYKNKKGYFKKAFQIFNKVIYSIFKLDYFPFSGLKIIAKGRFGKTRKQIARIQLGFLKLHTVAQRIYYSNNLLVTKRGSYGFHIWCSFENSEVFNGSSKKHVYYRL